MKQAQSLLAVATLAAMFCLAPAAVAQSSGLINVELGNVVNKIAENIRVDATHIPMNVRVPAEVAADVCKVAPQTLLSQGGGTGGGGCRAQTTSADLEQIILRQVKENNPK
jgi:hypothetical protein